MSLTSKHYRDRAYVQKRVMMAEGQGQNGGQHTLDHSPAEIVRTGFHDQREQLQLEAQEILNQEDSSITIIKEELGYWWDEYGVYMLGIPDIMIDGIPEIDLSGM